MMSWIATSYGKQFDYSSPDASMLDLRDIAHALAMTPRFAGHSARFYSVAEHSVEVAARLPPHLRAVGVLHDASEAYMTDLPTPLKNLCPAYKAIERKLQDIIYAEYLGRLPSRGAFAELKVADLTALRWEAWHLIQGRGADWDLWDGVPEPAAARPLCLVPEEAERLFKEVLGKCLGDYYE